MGTVVTTKPRKKAEPKKKGNSPYNILAQPPDVSIPMVIKT